MIPATYTGAVYDAETSAAASTKVTGPESGTGQDAFLKMFMAQMTHQNPLNPMDNTEFTAQLAQFSSLEQLTKISKSLEGLDDIKQTMLEGHVLNYLGKEVTLTGNSVPVANGKVGDIGFRLESSANVQAIITDASGKIVGDIDLGRLASGSHKVDWDGTDLAGQPVPDGLYAVTLNATDAQGNPVSVKDLQVTGVITGYSKDTDGKFHLLIGDVAIPLEGVLSVKVHSQSEQETGEEEQPPAEGEET